MRSLARRQPNRAGHLTAVSTLAAGLLLLAACGSATPPVGSLIPQVAASQPFLQATTPSPVPVPIGPTPRGNGTSSGSFGPGINNLPLPSAPPATATPAPPPPATKPPAVAPTKAPVAAATAHPTTPPSAGIATQPLGAPKIDVRSRLLYVGPDNKLWSVGRAGTDPRVALEKPNGKDSAGRVTNLNLSPDATKVLYTVAGSAYLLDLNSGVVTAQPYTGVWSQDSRHIVANLGNTQLVVVDVTSGAQDALGAGSNANWTFDGNIIAVRDGNVWLVPYPAGSSTAKQLTNFPTTGAQMWSFFNQLQYHYTDRVLFAGAAGGTLDTQKNGIRIESVDIPTHQVTALTAPGGADIRALAVSPSGLQVAVAEQVAGSGCAATGAIQIVRPLGGAAITVTLPHTADDFYYLRGLTWSPDQWLAYGGLEQKCVNGSAMALAPDRIFLVNPAAPGASRRLVDGAFPVWVTPHALGFVAPGAQAAR